MLGFISTKVQERTGVASPKLVLNPQYRPGAPHAPHRPLPVARQDALRRHARCPLIARQSTRFIENVAQSSAIEAIAELNIVSNEDAYSKREGIVRYIAVRRELPDSLTVHDDELPHDDGKPACAICVLITNIPATDESRKDRLRPKPMPAQAVLNSLAAPSRAIVSARTPHGGWRLCWRKTCTP